MSQNLTDRLDVRDSDPLSPADMQKVEQASRDRIAAWWDRAGIEPHLPANDETAVALVRSVDYDLDVERLARFCDVGAFDAVHADRNGRQWFARDIARLGLFLESRRQWQPHSVLHDCKKTPLEIAFENAREAGSTHDLFPDLDVFDLRSLLLMMAEADNRQMREILRVAIQTKLASFEIDA